MWTWTPYRSEYKGHRIEATTSYFVVYALGSTRQVIWEDQTEHQCRAWIDRTQTILEAPDWSN